MKHILAFLLSIISLLAGANAIPKPPIESIKLPGDVFTVVKLSEAQGKALEMKKPIAYICFDRYAKDSALVSAASTILRTMGKKCILVFTYKAIETLPADVAKGMVYDEKNIKLTITSPVDHSILLKTDYKEYQQDKKSVIKKIQTACATKIEENKKS